jgi:transcriptional regulator
MLKAIVGIEIPIRTVAGKWKASQNRPLPDKLGTIAGLNERGDANSRQMASLVERHVPSREG